MDDSTEAKRRENPASLQEGGAAVPEGGRHI